MYLKAFENALSKGGLTDMYIDAFIEGAMPARSYNSCSVRPTWAVFSSGALKKGRITSKSLSL